jgi:nicotinamide phosphoribosyltransferase
MTTNNKFIYPASLLCDFYKVSHREQYPHGTEFILSTWTPRTSRIKSINKIVAFGFQAFIKGYLIEYFNENFFNRPKQDIVTEYARVIKFTLGTENPDTSHIAALHDLGVPMLTIENTLPEFFWLTNFLETIMSNEIWSPSTAATMAFEYRKILEVYAKETNGDTSIVPFQGHDFSMRGMSSLGTSKSNGAGHLLSFTGTDTIPAILFLEEFYNANIENELVGTSIPATEHSCQMANGTDEFATIKRLITEVYPKGFVSIVSDTWDFWHVVDVVYRNLKDEIMARDGKVVVRPDSGDPVEIICGMEIIDLTENKYIKDLNDCDSWMEDLLTDRVRESTAHGEHGESEIESIFKYEGKYYKVEVEIDWNRYDKQYYFVDGHRITSREEIKPTPEQLGLIEVLWNIFGGTITEKGFKQLDLHIGAIYGDSITIERCTEICKRLKEKGFASTNMVYGIGSFSYQYVTRDTFGFALKSTFVVIDGEEHQIFKDPKTDDGTKKSQKGKVVVLENDGVISFVDGLSYEQHETYIGEDLLETVFLNGELVRDQSLSEIRGILLKNL